MNLVPAIRETKTQLNKIKSERDSQIRNLNFSFETLSRYCNVYKNNEEYFANGKYSIDDTSHIFVLEDNIYEAKDDVNIIAGLVAIKSQMDAVYRNYEQEISSLEEGIKTLRTMNTTCESCGGSGFLKKRTCAEDEGEKYICPHCKGTGKILK